MKSIFCLLFVFSTISFAGNFSNKKICILNFEREQHYAGRLVNRVFGGRPSTLIIHESKPKNIIDCFNQDYDEVVIISHALINEKAPQAVTWGYRRMIENERRDVMIKNRTEYLKNDYAEKYQQYKNLNCMIFTNMLYEDAPYKCHELESDLTDSKKQIDQMKWYLENDTAFYEEAPILKALFNKLPVNTSVKKIRIAICEPEKVFSFYSNFGEYLTNRNIEINFAPSLKGRGRFIDKTLIGRTLSYVTTSWLKESL